MITTESIDIYANGSGIEALADPQAFIDLAEQRLMVLLCLEEAPDSTLWEYLVSQYVKTLLDLNDINAGIKSKSVRNFSISFGSASFEDFNRNNADLLSEFSACPNGVMYQTDLKHREQGDRPDEPYGGIL